jgi:phosphoglycolate phosphatase-like HAD superfamily hydrolase
MSKYIELVLFNMIGTTIKDNYNGGSLIIDCFMKSFSQNEITVSFEQINSQRGKSKIEAIRNILIANNNSLELTNLIYSDFIGLLNSTINFFSEMDGATDIFIFLKEKNIKIGIGSGLPIGFMKKLITQLNWGPIGFDYIGSSDELGKGRPDPIMINDAMNKLGIKDKNNVLKIGDTIVDVQEGKNAGVLTAAVLTSTQTREEINKYQPDYIFDSIKDIKMIIQ